MADDNIKNAQIKITFPDGSSKEYPAGITPLEVAESIGPRLASDALAARIDGRMIDLNAPLNENTELAILTFDLDEGKKIYWHSTSHIMAEAVKKLFPNIKVAIGPAIDEGFYYDFDKETPFTPEDLEKIESEMQKIIEADLPFCREEMSKDDALKYFGEQDENYKLELIEEIEDEAISLYTQGNFTDFCRGPHIPSTGKIKAFKLTSIAGAYWRGDEKNAMLQRIYGVSFPKKAMLDDFLERMEEAKKRDHRKLGPQLELFAIDNEVGAGLVLWLPKGAIMRNIIEDFWKEAHKLFGYELVYSPHIARLELWETSGHTQFYTENMYQPMDIDEMKYQIKPMNCPFHMAIYTSRMRSYRELPIRWAELGTVYRYERSGVLHGLMRVRGFTQDDAHIFCTPDQLLDEIKGVIDITLYLLHAFGFHEYDVYLSTRPEKFVGTLEGWEMATKALRQALEDKKMSFKIDPGEGVFYGPKIDIKIKDALGRSWQCTTIQVDFNLPERFDLKYMGKDGEMHQPITIHRALLGSLERFFGVLIEHYAGNFPVWLAPVQAIILPITENQYDYAKDLYKRLKGEGIRVELDDRSEKVDYKIRDAETNKIPYMLIVGKREEEANNISIRKHLVGEQGTQTLEEWVKKVKEEIEKKGG
ncbi:threonine--tRNA ligase [bacterium]|nr:threonine--tRNA ligase [bacterium]